MAAEIDIDKLPLEVVNQLNDSLVYISANHTIAKGYVTERGEIVPAVAPGFDYTGSLEVLQNFDHIVRENGLYGQDSPLQQLFTFYQDNYIAREPENARLITDHIPNPQFQLFERLVIVYRQYYKPVETRVYDPEAEVDPSIQEARRELPDLFALFDNLFSGLDRAVEERVLGIINKLEAKPEIRKPESRKLDPIGILRNAYLASPDGRHRSSIHHALKVTLCRPKNLVHPDKLFASMLIESLGAYLWEQFEEEATEADPTTRELKQDDFREITNRRLALLNAAVDSLLLPE